MIRRLPVLALAATLVVLASSCDTAYGTMYAQGAGRPRCDQPTYYTIHDGDFTPAQIQDIHSAVGEIRNASHIDIRWAGAFAWWRHDTQLNGGPAQPSNHVVFEKRIIWTGSSWASGYGWPGNDGAGHASRGLVWISPQMDILRSPSAPGYGSGPTFRGAVLHEGTHAFVGLADMYDRDDGHPGLIMGDGYRLFNTYAAGDLAGVRDNGC